MTKFNKKTSFSEKLAKNPNKTVNYMGETAYTISDSKEKLLNLVATSMISENKYYESGEKSDSKIVQAISEVAEEDPKFILQLANYIRSELYLRSAPTFLLAHAASMEETKPFVREYTPKVIQRADELVEVLQLYKNTFLPAVGKKHTFPASLKKGVAAAFGKFDEYQFSKYDKDGEMKLKDALRIVIGFLNEDDKERRKLYQKILDGTLETPETWEVIISGWKDQGFDSKKKAWEHVIDLWTDGQKVNNYMALIRNLRNILEEKVSSKHMDKVINAIKNEKAVINSKQLPFRFLSAYENLGEQEAMFEKDKSHFKQIKEALNEAIQISVKHNVPKIPGKTIITADNSGSARGDYGGKSQISLKSVRSMADTGNLLALMAWYASEDTMVSVFGDKLSFIEPDRKKGILDNFKLIDKAGQDVGQSTEEGVFLMLEKMIREEIFADRLIVCSDLQIGDGKHGEYGRERGRPTGAGSIPDLVDKYRRTINPKFVYYSVCFNGHGNDVIIGPKKALISGWSDNILKFIQMFEKDKKSVIEHIESKY